MTSSYGAAVQPSCVLICGNTKLLDISSLRIASGFYKVVVCGDLSFAANTEQKLPRNVHLYPGGTTSEVFPRIMNSYTPEVVWYISGYADNGVGLDQEGKIIQRMMEQCGAVDCQKLIVVSSVNSLFCASDPAAASFGSLRDSDPRTFCCAQTEALVQYYARAYQLKTVLLRLPFLSQDINSGTWLGSVFAQLQQGKNVLLPGEKDQLADFISLRNLTELLISITEETQDSPGIYNVFSGFGKKWQDVADAIDECNPKTKVGYEPLPGTDDLIGTLAQDKTCTGNVRKAYGFVALDDVSANLPEAYSAFVEHHEKQHELRDRLRQFFSRMPNWLPALAEMLLLFAGMQLLLPITSNYVYFQFVDIRLFFVVIIGCSHGMLFGTLAGVLAGISTYISYTEMGLTDYMLFYNVDFWLPFSIFLLTGAITGYLKSTKDQKLKFMEEELFTLQNKYIFLNDVYRSVIESKKEYKRQILGYNDSFGKIFEAVQNLDSLMPSDIFLHGVETMEHILDNHSIAIYTLDEYQRYGRLAACSSSLSSRIAKSLSIETCKPVYDTVLGGTTWKNTDLIEDLPAYAFGILVNGKVRLLIFLQDVRNDQLTLYYMNLFTILCNLVRVSFVRSLEYQDAVQKEKYFEGTNVLQYPYFAKELRIQQNMAAAGVASYLLVRLNVDPKEDLNVLLKGLMRNTDSIGRNQKGECFLLLTQVNRDTFHFVAKRLDSKNISYTLVEDIEE